MASVVAERAFTDSEVGTAAEVVASLDEAAPPELA